MYRIYVLNPAHQSMGTLADLDKAKELARYFVEVGYNQAEVWDAIIPIWSIWREGKRRSCVIRTSDSLSANG